MKKMAADRRDSDPKPLIPELKVSEAAKRTSPMQSMGGMPAGQPAPPPPAAAIFGQPAIHGMTGPQQQQQLIFMQQQIRAQQLAALQVSSAVCLHFLWEFQLDIHYKKISCLFTLFSQIISCLFIFKNVSCLFTFFVGILKNQLFVYNVKSNCQLFVYI